MKRSCLWIVMLSTTVASAVSAQSPPPAASSTGDVAGEVERVLQESGVAVALDSVAQAAAPVLDETLSQLSVTLADLATRVASDPELRRSAFAAAEGLARLTSSVVAENAGLIQEVLRKAADELESVGSERSSAEKDGPARPSVAPSTPPTTEDLQTPQL